MALTYGFYNSVEGDRTYDAIQMGQIFDGIITDGVYATFLKAMVVKASDNPSEVIVQPGRCWFNHTWTYIDADYPVTAPAPEVILDRVDALVIDINTENAFRANSLVWVQGTPSSLNPERPTLIKSVTHNQYPLCYVYRKAGTTMIYAADITNAVGTSETPFVTGVLQGINIDDLLAQWDDEFHTWEAATKTSFEAWMVNQQSVYVTWFDSIKDQMEGDLTSFEAWFETIRGIIDEEAATHLQAEIDDILDMLPAGSHIDISTNEPTLFNRNVTVSDGVHSKTVQFNAIGGATVESFPYIGIIDVSSTDGERIASESLNIPYFGRYSVALAFWSATVNLVGDETLAGLAVTVRDGNGDVVAVVTLNGSGSGVFTATGPDTYKFIYTYGGQTMEVSLAVTQETTYEVEIHGGFNYQAWLDAGRVSETFESLDDILADEPTLRQLFLVHDSVDYICDSFTAGSLTDVTKIFNTDLAAKWINLSDYALDHFYAVSGIKSIMDTADKYGYGEWCLMPQVPTMTSDTAPYGTAVSSTPYSSNNAYKAFDGNTATYFSTITKSRPFYIGYQFVDTIHIEKIHVVAHDYYPDSFKVQGYNGTSWVDITETITNSEWEFDVDLSSNSTEYFGYRLYTETGTIQAWEIYEMQFYAWAPKGNVPKMTSNTDPYGAAVTDSTYSGFDAYKVFNGTYTGSTDCWASASNMQARIGYKFTNPVKMKKAVLYYNLNDTHATTAQLMYSDDNSNWTAIGESVTVQKKPNSSAYPTYATILEIPSNGDYHLYWAVRITTDTNTTHNTAFLQFYGRELKVSVPKMTSNTAPFGTASAKSSLNSSYLPWKVFDNDASTHWYSNANIGEKDSWVAYEFTSQTKLHMAIVVNANTDSTNIASAGTINIKNASDEVIASDTFSGGTRFSKIFDISGDNIGTLFKCNIVGNNGLGVTLTTVQFYGLDYSEKEFEVGTTKKWLYDHGLELEELTSRTGGTGSVPIKGDNSITLQSGGSSSYSQVYKNMDLSPYVLMRGKFEFYAASNQKLDVQDSNFDTIAGAAVSVNGPNNSNLNISNIAQTANAMVTSSSNANSKMILLEFWLE